MRPDARAVLVLALTLASGALAQRPDSVPDGPALQRARQLFADGRGADARRVIDSILRVATPDSAVYADALHLRASNAATAADAERDYRRLLIETPLSVRAEDALLRLAELHEARGDRQGASEHLRRFLLSYANHPARPRAALSLVRLLFEQGPSQAPQLARACEALRAARDEIPAANAEMRNQLEYYAPRCAYVEAAPAADTPAADTSRRTEPARANPSARAPDRAPARAPTPSRPAVPAPSPPSAPTATTAPAGAFSVQVAAYDSPEPARRLVATLRARGIDARVDGAARPYRVRVGRYATRAEAARMQTSLRSQGYNGFVTTVR